MKSRWVITDYRGFVKAFNRLDDAKAFLVAGREGAWHFSDIHREGGLETVEFTPAGASGRTHIIQRVQYG